MQIRTYEKRFAELFDSEIEAAKRYNELALKYHGEYANINEGV